MSFQKIKELSKLLGLSFQDKRNERFSIGHNNQVTSLWGKHLYIDSWNKENVEERLLKYPELIDKFSNIVKKIIQRDKI